jgi:uncharacterized protein
MTPKEAIRLLREAGCSPDIIEHCQMVAECAREIAEQYNSRHDRPADIELVTIGALLHDIGRARSQKVKHVVIGAEIARSLGLDERIVRIIERHIGAGIPKKEAAQLGFPEKDYMPETIEEMIVAHADNLVDGTTPISIDERIRRMKRRRFRRDAIKRMVKLHAAVME